MKRLNARLRNAHRIISFLLLFMLFGCQGFQVKGSEENPILGPQSKLARGEQRVLMVAVEFPDVEPSFPLERIRKKAVGELNQYIKEQSYDLTWIKADFRGWIKLPDPISEYKISPYHLP